MIFDAKILAALVFVIISLLIIFSIKSRTTAVITLIIAHLVLVLFFSLSISNYNSFKELVLGLVAYSMVLLFLISNHNPIFSYDAKHSPKQHSKWSAIYVPLVTFAILIVVVAIFLVVQNVPRISQSISDKKIEKQNEALLNPMILPSHPVHVAVRKFYLGKKMESDGNAWVDKVQLQSEINERKQARLKDKLADNFLLKRSSDVILIIVAISTSLLLLGARKTENNS
jgi:D-alanyl-lipoteichoic acid acyltransferase DltB (MBOAT superfamily)